MKTHSNLVELMHREIDGANTPAESETLRRELTARPEVQKELYELRQVCSAIESIEDVAPPADLKASILEAVRFAPPQSARGRSRRAKSAWWPKPLGFGYLYAVAAGALFVLVLVQFVNLGGPDAGNPSELIGTLAHRPVGSGGGLGEFKLTSPGLVGVGKVRQLEAGYAVEFSFDTPDLVEVVVDFDASDVGFRGFAQDPEVLQGLELTSKHISWTQTGDRRTAVLFAPKTLRGAKIRVKVARPGQSQGGNEIDLPAQG